MKTNNHQIKDYDAVLDAKFGKIGTPERMQAEEDAYAFYTVIHEHNRPSAGERKANEWNGATESVACLSEAS